MQMRLAAAVLALVVFAAGCGDDDESDSVDSAAVEPAQKLVELDTGPPPAADDPDVQRVARHLASLDKKCGGSVTDAAQSVDFSARLLETEGVEESRVSLVARFDREVKGSKSRSGCVTDFGRVRDAVEKREK